MAPRFTARLPAGHLSARATGATPFRAPTGGPSFRAPTGATSRPPVRARLFAVRPAPKRRRRKGLPARRAPAEHGPRLLRDTGFVDRMAARLRHEPHPPRADRARDARAPRRGAADRRPTLRDPARRARLRRPRAAGGAGVHTSRHDRSSAAARAGHGARGVRADDRRGREGGPGRPPRRRPGVCRAHGLRDRARARGGSPAATRHEGGGRD